MALDLEEQQCVHFYLLYILSSHLNYRRTLRQLITQMRGKQTSKQQADLQDKRTTLLRRIQRWREIQLTYVPCVGPILAAALCMQDTDSPVQEPAELVPLHLPSSLPGHLRDTNDLSSIIEKEKRLRVAQADDALAEIRRQRRIITGLWHF